MPTGNVKNPGGRPVIVDIDKLKELHGAGLSDGEIADQLGVKRTTVIMARKRLGLPANRKVGQHGSIGTRPGEEEEVIAFCLREQHVLAVRELSGPRVRVGNGDLLKWAGNAYALDISHIEYIYALDESSRPADIPEKIPAVISTIEAVSYGFKKGKGGGKRALVYNTSTE
jgi:hypothetical protein